MFDNYTRIFCFEDKSVRLAQRLFRKSKNSISSDTHTHTPIILITQACKKQNLDISYQQYFSPVYQKHKGYARIEVQYFSPGEIVRNGFGFNKNQIPSIDFSLNSLEIDRGTDKWYSLCKRVREACETYGCFEIVYDRIPLQLRAETFTCNDKATFQPSGRGTKQKNLSPMPYHGYFGQYASIPLYESFGLEDASNVR